jgi:hypothetical protein
MRSLGIDAYVPGHFASDTTAMPHILSFAGKHSHSPQAWTKKTLSAMLQTWLCIKGKIRFYRT